MPCQLTRVRLSQFLADGRARTDDQHERLLEAIQGVVANLQPALADSLSEDVVRRMHNMPTRAEEEAACRTEEAEQSQGQGQRQDGVAADDTDGETVVGSDIGGERAAGVKREPDLAGFAEVERRMTGTNKLRKAWRTATVKGPRRLNMWGLGKLSNSLDQ